MHPSASGATDWIVFRSFSRAARLSSLTLARYSSIVVGLLAPALAFFITVDPSVRIDRAENKTQRCGGAKALRGKKWKIGEDGERGPLCTFASLRSLAYFESDLAPPGLRSTHTLSPTAMRFR